MRLGGADRPFTPAQPADAAWAEPAQAQARAATPPGARSPASHGLCDEGGAAAFIDAGDNTYGGKVVTNPPGGLLSKGHPLGATGLVQCYELTHQLRGTGEQRQVPGARLGLQHKLGLGGACVVTL